MYYFDQDGNIDVNRYLKKGISDGIGTRKKVGGKNKKAGRMESKVEMVVSSVIVMMGCFDTLPYI